MEEFSSILSALKAKVTVGGSSSSEIVIVVAEDIELVALVGEVLGVTIIVSAASSTESLIPLNLIVPDVDPVSIVIKGFCVLKLVE